MNVRNLDMGHLISQDTLRVISVYFGCISTFEIPETNNVAFAYSDDPAQFGHLSSPIKQIRRPHRESYCKVLSYQRSASEDSV